MDKQTKKTIKIIKWNYIMLNVSMLIILFFVIAIFITSNIENKTMNKQTQNSINKLNEIANKITEVSNYAITSVYQNEEIKQKVVNIENNRNWDLR